MTPNTYNAHSKRISETFASQFAKMKRLPGKQRAVPGWAVVYMHQLAEQKAWEFDPGRNNLRQGPGIP